MPLTPAETARKVANIIDHENERFDMWFFKDDRECGTASCIAGHTALLHGDSLTERAPLWEDYGGEWLSTQGVRLGLARDAARKLFYPTNHTQWLGEDTLENERRYSLVLRRLEKELADRDPGDLIDMDELVRIAEEALA